MRNEDYEKTGIIISKEDYPKWNVSPGSTVRTDSHCDISFRTPIQKPRELFLEFPVCLKPDDPNLDMWVVPEVG